MLHGCGLRLGLPLSRRRRSLLPRGRRRLLRTRLRLNLWLTLRRRSWRRFVLWRRRLLRTHLWLNLLLTLRRRCLGRPVLRRRRLLRTSLRLCLRLNLLLAGGWRGRRSSRRLICRRLVAIRLLLHWRRSRRRLRAGPSGRRLVVIRRNVLLSRVGLPGCV